ncbi:MULTISPECIES: GNAT family N-acetyltransferase [Streptomyces]|uniref:GNAT family N-acetyltransferase n=1 Tax=Streptomyces tendae TaxID=1932 RepID=A0ABX5ZZ96_STRTE|nr:GNAT family N-acetyltransferase [Streptomyces tendae]QER89472.1 GNAT family N-acetyltransferase [Streptomyces tendae]
MSDLRIQAVDGATMLEQWRHVHNVVVPPAAMSPEEARERLDRGYRLDNAYDGDELVGCSTVRPPTGADAVATVIARVLPGHRRKGFGSALHEAGLEQARAAGAGAVETVVLAANEDGVRFARARGFDETERYVLPGETDLWLTLRLRAWPRTFPS